MKIYKWGILGTGKIAKTFATDLALLKNAQLYAVASRETNKANAFAAELGFERAFDSYEELVNDPKVDIIYIATPHVFHYPNALLCLKNKKAVLCEKPLAINELQVKAMLETAKTNATFFMEALWTRFIPSFEMCRELIAEGAIGELRLVEADFCFRTEYDPTSRLFAPELGGGSLLDIGIYPVFMSLSTLGYPEKVEAMASLTDKGVDTKCSILMKHKHDAMSVLFSSLEHNGRTEANIHGTKGSLHIKPQWHKPSEIELIRKGQKTQQFTFNTEGNGYQFEAAEVMQCLDEGRIESTKFSWNDSLQLIRLMDLIRKKAGIHYPEETEKI